MPATDTAELVITCDSLGPDNTLQDAIHVLRDNKVTFALAADGAIPVGTGASREFSYDESTVPIPILGSNFGQASVLIQCPERTFNGRPMVCDIYLPSVNLGQGTAPVASFALFEGNAPLGVFGQLTVQDDRFVALWRFTPSAGKHTYALKAWVAPRQGSPVVNCGAGGIASKSYVPAFLRFSFA